MRSIEAHRDRCVRSGPREPRCVRWPTRKLVCLPLCLCVSSETVAKSFVHTAPWCAPCFSPLSLCMHSAIPPRSEHLEGLDSLGAG